MAESESGRTRRLAARAREAVQRANHHPRLLTAARLARELLPGDSQFGDPLSTAGSDQPQVVGRRVAQLTERRPGVLREAGLSALQVWESLSEAQGRGRGDRDLAIVFTDLAAFSDWVLRAGDDRAVELLRDVDRVMEPAVKRHGGEVVKRLGDGMMAVFTEPDEALRALVETRDGLSEVQVDDYEPRVRAGMHVGRPRKLGGDYFGVDVNIAARLAEQASPDEVLVSDAAIASLDSRELNVRRRRRFKVKGVPRDMAAYSVTP